MSSFILFFSILIIIVSICLIIFSNKSVLSNFDDEFNIKQESSHKQEHKEHSDYHNFEKIFQEEIEPVSKLDNYFNYDNSEELLNSKSLREDDELKNKVQYDDNINDITKMAMSINSLKETGLSNQEIAKKLGKGIREIDIILKMNKLKSSSNK